MGMNVDDDAMMMMMILLFIIMDDVETEERRAQHANTLRLLFLTTPSVDRSMI